SQASATRSAVSAWVNSTRPAGVREATWRGDPASTQIVSSPRTSRSITTDAFAYGKLGVSSRRTSRQRSADRSFPRSRSRSAGTNATTVRPSQSYASARTAGPGTDVSSIGISSSRPSTPALRKRAAIRSTSGGHMARQYPAQPKLVVPRSQLETTTPGDDLDAQEERIARNEALFREVNERIAESAQRFESHRAEFVCECADQDCTERVEATLDEYERV